MQFSFSALYSWYRDVIRNPKYRWWIVLGTLGYLLLPFDISPDFLPIVGQVDDIALLSLLVTELSQELIEWFKKRNLTASEQPSDGVIVDTLSETVETPAVRID